MRKRTGQEQRLKIDQERKTSSLLFLYCCCWCGTFNWSKCRVQKNFNNIPCRSVCILKSWNKKKLLLSFCLLVCLSINVSINYIINQKSQFLNVYLGICLLYFCCMNVVRKMSYSVLDWGQAASDCFKLLSSLLIYIYYLSFHSGNLFKVESYCHLEPKYPVFNCNISFHNTHNIWKILYKIPT